MKLNGKKIDIHIIDNGYDNESFCEASGISRRTLTDARKGKNISLKTAAKFANTLDVPIAELLIEDKE